MTQVAEQVAALLAQAPWDELLDVQAVLADEMRRRAAHPAEWGNRPSNRGGPAPDSCDGSDLPPPAPRGRVQLQIVRDDGSTVTCTVPRGTHRRDEVKDEDEASVPTDS